MGGGPKHEQNMTGFSSAWQIGLVCGLICGVLGFLYQSWRFMKQHHYSPWLP